MAIGNYVITIDDVSFLTLLQVNDSAFPSGGYTQSFGLETLAQEESITNSAELEQVLTLFLFEKIGKMEGLLLYQMREEGIKRDLAEICRLESKYASYLLARESREGSLKMGRQMMRTLGFLQSDPFFTEYMSLCKQNREMGHHAVVYGLFFTLLGLEAKAILYGYISSSLTSLLINALRLTSIGQTEIQLICQRMQPKIKELVEKIIAFPDQEWGSTSPQWEIAAMRHERLYSRLFMS